ncbi:thiamine pyrophosphate-binding protein [Lactobacillus sp. ESL0731]|uniref:thiamine pyrophosphate-dependent enzyme n=1 Tax=unclassified Lactobacillus TaxID=2620435 RepID=UPI0023F9C28C|nr:MULTISPECIES: thiamine pyrophosphate-binding protein [unclassified Lactobacillus]WEV51040.1 thiamine pyrophosphate-binding protein [Lactobacillus sp. ESL0700]WEV62171.1 thiamine pyrophosphate-binding protein [Lactobacillus sp. ESL0731]
MTKMMAGQALAKVLEKWDVDHVYGITADSINNTVDGLYQERDHIRYIQVRHEEVGALAAAADAKLTGKIGVAFGSAGPGSVHMLNGLYDAKMDHVPVLALVGQTSTAFMNTNFFQEMNQDPIYADVAQFHKLAANAEQIPSLIDEAIRSAYATKSVSVVVLPDDLSGQEIEYVATKTAALSATDNEIAAKESDVAAVFAAIKNANKPIMWLGQGARGNRVAAVAVADKFGLPVLTTAPAADVFPTDHPNYMGARGRLGTKPAFDVSQDSDLILYIGTNYPFARFLPNDKTIIQVNNNLADLGKQHDADITVLADAKDFLEKLAAVDYQAEPTAFLKAAQKDRVLWVKWLEKLAADDHAGLRAESVIQAIKENSTKDAIFGLDVGNNTEWALRQLPFDQDQKYAMSAWYGTMGFGLPAGLAAKLSFARRQVWTISGDGGYAMVMPDLLTEVKYHLPVVNVVLENKSFGFIGHEKLQANQAPYGIDLVGADWAKAAESMGAIGLTATNLVELKAAMTKIEQLQASGNNLPIVLDAKILDIDPIDTNVVMTDENVFGIEAVADYRKTYELSVTEQPTFSQLLADAVDNQ